MPLRKRDLGFPLRADGKLLRGYMSSEAAFEPTLAAKNAAKVGHTGSLSD